MDKQTKWDESGIAGLIPDTLIQGLTGHPFGSPDMIGGGEYTCFLNGNENACTPGDVCAVCADCGFDAGDAVFGFSLEGAA